MQLIGADGFSLCEIALGTITVAFLKPTCSDIDGRRPLLYSFEDSIADLQKAK